VVSELVFLDDFAGIAPVEVVLFEFVAARVIADAALTGVADDFRLGAKFAASGNFVDVHGGLSLRCASELILLTALVRLLRRGLAISARLTLTGAREADNPYNYANLWKTGHNRLSV
jgi:hypothetical protein